MGDMETLETTLAMSNNQSYYVSFKYFFCP